LRGRDKFCFVKYTRGHSSCSPATVEGLEDELQWPDAEKRQQSATVFPGMFIGCIGVAEVKEY
jgi:hypothetical protein